MATYTSMATQWIIHNCNLFVVIFLQLVRMKSNLRLCVCKSSHWTLVSSECIKYYIDTNTSNDDDIDLCFGFSLENTRKCLLLKMPSEIQWAIPFIQRKSCDKRTLCTICKIYKICNIYSMENIFIFHSHIFTISSIRTSRKSFQRNSDKKS